MECILLNSDFHVKNKASIALGFFDGVHLGHQRLIEAMKLRAKDDGLESVIVTFNKHPLSIAFPKYAPKLITSNEEKVKIFKSLGIDKVVLLDFNEEMMNLDPEDFIKDIIVKQLNAKSVVVGFNYNFGYQGRGTPSLLKELGIKYDFDVTVVEPCCVDGQVVSSTFIRGLIESGKVHIVDKYLGKKFSIIGEVVKGKGLGRKHNIPTANIRVPEEHITPATGVYYTSVCYRGEFFRGLTNVGHNPTFEKHPFSVETHLLDFSDDLYGDKIEVSFNEKIREEKKFKTVDELFNQINRDINFIRQRRSGVVSCKMK